MFYEPSTQTEYTTVESFRLAYPNTSFGDLYVESNRIAAGLYSIVDSVPSYDRELQQVTPGGVEQIDGIWYRQYTVSDRTLTDEERMAILVGRYDAALTAHLDATAQTRRYDNRITCAVRSGYPGPFQAEGQAFAIWMDSCNAYAYQLLSDVAEGNRLPPESPDAFIAELPEMVWPT
jgi:hypothetical protein